MTPQMKQFQSIGRGMRTNPCSEIILMGSTNCDLGISRFGAVNRKKPLDERVWRNAEGVKIPLGKMNRGHIQAALQWCHQRRNSDRTKDGYTYNEWIAMFFAKMMDPNTLE